MRRSVQRCYTHPLYRADPQTNLGHFKDCSNLWDDKSDNLVHSPGCNMSPSFRHHLLTSKSYSAGNEFKFKQVTHKYSEMFKFWAFLSFQKGELRKLAPPVQIVNYEFRIFKLSDLSFSLQKQQTKSFSLHIHASFDIWLFFDINVLFDRHLNILSFLASQDFTFKALPSAVCILCTYVYLSRSDEIKIKMAGLLWLTL